jgi:class 3 adenylate cyclase
LPLFVDIHDITGATPEQIAHVVSAAGAVLVPQSERCDPGTRTIFEDLGDVMLKGFDQPTRAHALAH